MATVETPGCIWWLLRGAFTRCLPGMMWIIFHLCSPGRKFRILIFSLLDIPVRQRSRWMPARGIPGDAGDTCNMDDPRAMIHECVKGTSRIEHKFQGQLMCN